MATLFRPGKRPSYYHRAIIPRRLRPWFQGRAQVWRSLSTNDRDLATLKALAWETHAKQLFLTLKRQGRHMTPAEIETLITRWMNAELDKTEDMRAAYHFNDDQRNVMTSATIDQLEDAEEALSGKGVLLAPEADALLEAAGLPPLAHESLAFKRLCRRLLLAKKEVLTLEVQRWQHHYPPTTLKPSVPVVAAPPVKAGPLFSVVAPKYLAENPRARRMQDQVRVEFDRFLEAIGGDRPIGHITKAEGRAYKEHLLQVRKVSLATVTKHLHTLSGLFSWAEKQGYRGEGSTNPVKGLAPHKKLVRQQEKKIRPFTPAELLAVFGSQDFREQRERHPERYWTVLLCLFHICRREEAAQLALKDIQEEDGIPYLSITDAGDDQALKNEGSKRRLPVHSSLIQLGFLKYVHEITAAGHQRLFPQLPRQRNGYSDAIGKYFARLLNKVGLSDPLLVFHSLRHTGIHQLQKAGCPHHIEEMLAGHAAQGIHDKVYAHRELTPLSLLQEGLEKLRYDDVVKALAQGGPHA